MKTSSIRQPNSQRRVSTGSLKLSPQEHEEFRAAIEAYDFQQATTFLQLCVKMIIKHHKAGDQIRWPIALQLAKSDNSKNVAARDRTG